MICPKCQAQNPEVNQFCVNCGVALSASGSTEITATTPATQIPPVQPLKSKKPLIIVGLGLFFLLLVAGITTFVILPKLKKEKISTPLTQPSSSPFSSFKEEEQQPSSGQQATLTKYDIDTDGDAIPDFVETATNHDPNKDECLLAVCEGFDPNAPSKTQTNILFILDSSGSMGEKSGSQVKMDAAKAALKKYVSTIKSGTNIGLMVYGHKGSNSTSQKAVSCAGIDLLYPIGSPDIAGFTQAIDSFRPTGWTPIGSAFRQAKSAFTGLDSQSNRILLITDGIETCDSDPVGATRELQATGIKLVVDVIGFSLDSSAKSQMQQVTQVGGGNYYDATSSDDFQKTLDTWSEDTLKNQQLIGCRAGADNTFAGCVAKRSNDATSFLNKISLSLYADSKPYNGVTASTDDSHEAINRAMQKIQTYNQTATQKFLQNSNQMWQEYLQNQQKIGQTPY